MSRPARLLAAVAAAVAASALLAQLAARPAPVEPLRELYVRVFSLLFVGGILLGALAALAERGGARWLGAPVVGLLFGGLGLAVFVAAERPARGPRLGVVEIDGEECVVRVVGRLPGGRLHLEGPAALAAVAARVRRGAPPLERWVGRPARVGLAKPRALAGRIEAARHGAVRIGARTVPALGICAGR